MVKPGYKQTEIGVIPEDWDCVRLGEKAKIYRGGSPRPIQDYITTSSDGANWIKIGDVRENDKYIRSTQEKITPEGISKSREVHIGDFILSNSMSFGRPYILDIDGCIHDGWLTIQDYKNTFSTEYLYYLLSSDLVYQQYIGMAAGSSVKNLNKDKVSALYVIYSAFSEQERIAEALSDVDELISSLEKLIEKYKSIKATCLQQMFPQKGETTPKMRLPGFTGAWEQRKLGDVGKARSGVGFPDTEQGGAIGVPFFKVSDMNSDGNENEMTVANNYVTAEQIAAHRWAPIAELPAIFFAKVGAAVMLNRKRLCRFPFLLDNNTMAYSLNSTKWEADFAKALFETVDLTSLVQVGALPSYNSGDVEAIEIYLPSLLEQAEIGAFFKHFDNLITLHQRKLNKAKKIKQGMMQQLLTGKIRFV